MQTVRKHGLSVFALLLMLTCNTEALAAGDNLYRAELVLIQRVDSQEDVGERMQSRHPSTPDDITKTLLALSDSGQAYSDLDLVSPSELYLSNAARRLKNSGRFRILMQAGWYQSFPPDYKGERMRVAVGDLLPTGEPGQERREVEGYININRQRYLHVNAQINQWEKIPPKEAEEGEGDNRSSSPKAMQNGDTESSDDRGTKTDSAAVDYPGEAAKQSTGSVDNGSATDEGITSGQSTVAPNSGPEMHDPKIQLLTWLHETRRMRSGKIHYLGSPTIGLLVYFAPIEQKDEAAVPEDENDSAEKADDSADSGTGVQ